MVTSPAGVALDELRAALAGATVTALTLTDGDELLLLAPDLDTAEAENVSAALAELFPTVTFLVLCGAAGAVRMPRRPPGAPS